MKNELEIFKNEEFGEVRVVEIDGKSYFMASDIAKSLGYTNPNKAINDHCRAITKWCTPISGKIQEVNFIPEGDIYRLISRSKLPSAEKFEAWVFDEVLITIRKHGAYMTEETLEHALTDPDFLIKLATQLKTEKEARIAAEKTLKSQEKLVTCAKQLAQSDGVIGMNEMAKIASKHEIKIGRNELFKFLRSKKILMFDNTPYQVYMNKKYFEVIPTTFETKRGNRITPVTLVTGKGQLYIIDRLKNEYIRGA